jgi:hypothetical protein
MGGDALLEMSRIGPKTVVLTLVASMSVIG